MWFVVVKGARTTEVRDRRMPPAQTTGVCRRARAKTRRRIEVPWTDLVGRLSGHGSGLGRVGCLRSGRPPTQTKTKEWRQRNILAPILCLHSSVFRAFVCELPLGSPRPVGIRPTPELTDAGGQGRPNWKLTRPARVRSSDLVRLFHGLTFRTCATLTSQ